MNFKESNSVFIPLKDPVENYGERYRIVNVFLTNSNEQVTHVNVPESSLDVAYFEQEFDRGSLDLRWHIKEPTNGEIIKETAKIKKDKYISGFDVTIYKNNRDLIGESATSDRAFIRKYTGISGNSFSYQIEDFSIRSYSVDIDAYDYFNNVTTATFITKNPEPSAEILSYEDVGGVLEIQYQGSHDLEYLRVSNYSGLRESEFHESYTGSNGLVSVPLIPNLPNYLKIEPYDGFGYSKPISMSGYSLEEKKSYPFKLKIKSIKLNKKSGGRSVEFDMQANFEKNPYVSAKYKVLTSGNITGAEAGYDDYIYLDNGEFNNTDLNIKNTGFNYTIDNQFTWQNSISTGDLSAGEDDPEYAYWDSINGQVKSMSLHQVRSGKMPINGIFSMPINDPNSYDIKFRSGINFRGEYEKASSYLNTIGEMPAVILNESQANKMRSYQDAIGWIGLRRGRVGLMEELFSENQINQGIFSSVDFKDQDSRLFSSENKSGQVEDINYISNDVGQDWAWVNSSGTQIYKNIISGQYIPETYFDFEIDAESTISNDHTSIQKKLFVLPIDFSDINAAINSETLSISYSMKDGDLVDYVDLHTGIINDFEISTGNLAAGYTYQEEETFDYTVDKNNPPKYFKANFKDFLGNTEVVDINQVYYDDIGEDIVDELRFYTSSQNTLLSLDHLVGQNIKKAEVEFSLNHTGSPSVEFSINYSGSNEEPEFINAMISGEPTESGVTLFLDKVPPETGYSLGVISNSS